MHLIIILVKIKIDIIIYIIIILKIIFKYSTNVEYLKSKQYVLENFYK